MRKYNKLMMLSFVFYIALAVCTGVILKGGQDENSQFHKVEINRILADIRSAEDLESIDLRPYREVKSIAFLSASGTDRETVLDFYDGINGRASTIYPLYTYDNMSSVSAEKRLDGYIRFDYEKLGSNMQCILWAEGALFLMELFLFSVLFYLRNHLIQPFHRMQDMTYALSKGNLQGEVKAEKNQYLGKFLWGLSGLRDALDVSRRRELELQREKKMLLLSLSHDIKTPLNMIKLYGRALEDGIYSTDTEQMNAYRQIGEKAAQIEDFVSEIMRASKEDIVHIEIEEGEFYLKELVQWIDTFYGEKCALRKCSLTIGAYQNRIFRGDLNRLSEVFENLFANAFKYGDGRQIKISFYEEDYCQLISVFNTGEPVSGKAFVHLFDSFFRGENTRGQQGNGLGLYICKEIMHKMGGEIFAECKQDGMAFVVVLPL